MTKNLTDAPETFPVQTSPVAGEPRTAGSVEGPFQRAANRTAYLLDRHNHIDPTKEGVRRLRRFVDFTAMRASVDVPDATVAQVAGAGIYEFSGLSVVAELEPLVIRPNAILSTAPGRWLLTSWGIVGAANGVAPLNGDGRLDTSRLAASNGGSKVLAENVKNGIVATRQLVHLASEGTSTSDWTDVFETNFDFTMKQGDIVMAVGRLSRRHVSADVNAHHGIRWVVNGSETPLITSQDSLISPTGSATFSEPIGWWFVAPADGAYVFQLQQSSPDSASVIVGKITVFAVHLRP